MRIVDVVFVFVVVVVTLNSGAVEASFASKTSFSSFSTLSALILSTRVAVQVLGLHRSGGIGKNSTLKSIWTYLHQQCLASS